MTDKRTYLCIDLKSFYASVECAERGLDPMRTNLVVADVARTEKTICLAVTPSLKACGIPGRARLFEVVQRVREINAMRLAKAPKRKFEGSSCDSEELKRHPELELSYIAATPRMALYMDLSTRIYEIYLRFVAPEDIHIYSIDEVFIDATSYLEPSGLDAEGFARRLMRSVLEETGITATAGIGTNLYLAKIAMDIMAKKNPPDEFGSRLASLDERSYRVELWEHRPLIDFWRVGRGYQKKLEAGGIYTMGDVARCSIDNEDKLYRMFGVNAELLIDHAWGYEPCTMADIKAYKPETNSISTGQVLSMPYSFDKARIVCREMAETMALDLFEKGLVTDQLTLYVGFDVENLKDPAIRDRYTGETVKDSYGRSVPKHAMGTRNLGMKTSSARLITSAALDIFDTSVDPLLFVRRFAITANRVEKAENAPAVRAPRQMDLFSDGEEMLREREAEDAALEREKKVLQAVVDIKKKYGRNAILKGTDLEEGATTAERNDRIGGHRA